ncbi:MAG: hypothetical protein HYR60_30145 [Acidobacteria bacterium]|nr:hypothetical protein [Acidobacteriota bacterium]
MRQWLRIASLAAGAVLAAQQETVFRVDVRLVRILATVKNGAGRLVGDMAK